MRAVIGLVLASSVFVPAQVLAQASGQPASVQPETKGAAPAKPKVYDEKADGAKQIQAALASAKKNNRRVLVQWGANWCGWCVQLHGLFGSNAQIKKELMYEYDIVYIDMGRFDKHVDLAEGYGANLKEHGLPFLTVLGADGKAVANQDTGSLENKDANGESTTGHDPAKVMEFLKKNQAPYQDAQAVLDAAMADAKKDGKQVFLHFGAPWCGWCHKLEGWMEQPVIASLLTKEFVDCKIDMDRTTGAETVAKKFRKKDGGIPWFCFLSADGAKVADSDGADGNNVGFPYEPAEIEHFKTMLTNAAKKLTAEEIETITGTMGKNPKVKATPVQERTEK